MRAAAVKSGGGGLATAAIQTIISSKVCKDNNNNNDNDNDKTSQIQSQSQNRHHHHRHRHRWHNR